MSIVPGALATEEQISKAIRNVDNTPLTAEHKTKLRALLGLYHKTWEEECVLPAAVAAHEEAEKKRLKQAEKDAKAAAKEKEKKDKKDAAPSVAETSPAAGPLSSPSESGLESEQSTTLLASIPVGNEEKYFLSVLTPTKGRLQPNCNIDNYTKASNPLHLAAKISTLYKDFFSIRCLIRLLWANKWVVEKAYQNSLYTILWRHHNLPRYWTEDEIRPCVRMRYMDWYGVSNSSAAATNGTAALEISESHSPSASLSTVPTAPSSAAASASAPATAPKEAPCVILQLRAHCSDLTISQEARCKFVLIALEKGISYMRQQYHGSQRKVLEQYAARRPNEPFVFLDDKPDPKKKDKKDASKTPPPPPPPMTEAALQLLEEEIRGIISEAQKEAAAAYNSNPTALPPLLSRISSGLEFARASPANVSPATSPATAKEPRMVNPEECIGEDELLDGSEQLILLMDETESTSDKMDTKFLRFLCPILFSHYVERLRYCIVVNPTFISTMCVNIIKMVVDERTKSKLKLMDIDPYPLDDLLYENNLTWPGRVVKEPPCVVAAAATSSCPDDSQLSQKEKEKKEKERLKEKAKRCKGLPYDDLAFPSQEIINILGIDNTPIKYGGRMPPLSANHYESWFNALPPFADPSQEASEAVREATRCEGLK